MTTNRLSHRTASSLLAKVSFLSNSPKNPIKIMMRRRERMRTKKLQSETNINWFQNSSFLRFVDFARKEKWRSKRDDFELKSSRKINNHLLCFKQSRTFWEFSIVNCLKVFIAGLERALTGLVVSAFIDLCRCFHLFGLSSHILCGKEEKCFSNFSELVVGGVHEFCHGKIP